MIPEPVTLTTMTHGSALAVIMALAAMLGGVAFFFTRERQFYYKAVATLFVVFTGVYWFGVRPEIEEVARHGNAAYHYDKVAPPGATAKSIDNAGRFVRPADLR